MGSTGGTLAGIARRAAPRAPMEVLDAADLSVEAGVGEAALVGPDVDHEPARHVGR